MSSLSPSEAANLFDRTMQDVGVNAPTLQAHDYWFRSLAELAMNGQTVSTSEGAEMIQDENYWQARTAHLISTDLIHNPLLSEKTIFKREVALQLRQTGNSNGLKIERSLKYGIVFEEMGHKRLIKLNRLEKGFDLIHHGTENGSLKLAPSQLSALVATLKKIGGIDS